MVDAKRSAIKGLRISVLMNLALLPSGALGVNRGSPGDGRTPVLNRSEVRLMAGRFGAETPQRPYSIRFFHRAGSNYRVVRFELRPGEQRANEEPGAQRAELRSYASYRHGETRWYSGAFRIGEFLPDSQFNIITQWHGNFTGSPWLRFALQPNRRGRLLIQHNGRDANGRERPYSTTAINISLNQWHRFVVEARTDQRAGRLRVWIDGRPTVDWAHGLLGDFLSHGATASRLGFWKFGFYRWGIGQTRRPVRSTAIVWFTNMEQAADLSARVDHPLPLPRPGAWSASN